MGVEKPLEVLIGWKVTQGFGGALKARFGTFARAGMNALMIERLNPGGELGVELWQTVRLMAVQTQSAFKAALNDKNDSVIGLAVQQPDA